MGALNLLWVDAATFLVSFLILVTWLPQQVSLAENAAARTGMFGGARAVLSNPMLRRIAASALCFGLLFPVLLATLPVLAIEQFGGDAASAGTLFAALGAGAVIGMFVVC